MKLAAAHAGAKLQQLLLLMAQQPLYEEKKARANRRSDHALDEVRLELEINFQQPPDVAALAASSGLSRNFFAARFRERETVE
jgi:hypothetical protein